MGLWDPPLRSLSRRPPLPPLPNTHTQRETHTRTSPGLGGGPNRLRYHVQAIARPCPPHPPTQPPTSGNEEMDNCFHQNVVLQPGNPEPLVCVTVTGYGEGEGPILPVGCSIFSSHQALFLNDPCLTFSSHCFYTIPPPATAGLARGVISQISPQYGSLAGGTLLTISGSGFARGGIVGSTDVYIGALRCDVIDYYSDDTRLVCRTP